MAIIEPILSTSSSQTSSSSVTSPKFEGSRFDGFEVIEQSIMVSAGTVNIGITSSVTLNVLVNDIASFPQSSFAVNSITAEPVLPPQPPDNRFAHVAGSVVGLDSGGLDIILSKSITISLLAPPPFKALGAIASHTTSPHPLSVAVAPAKFNAHVSKSASILAIDSQFSTKSAAPLISTTGAALSETAKIEDTSVKGLPNVGSALKHTSLYLNMTSTSAKILFVQTPSFSKVLKVVSISAAVITIPLIRYSTGCTSEQRSEAKFELLVNHA